MMRTIYICNTCLLAFADPKESNDHEDKAGHRMDGVSPKTHLHTKLKNLLGEKKIIQLTPEQYGFQVQIKNPDSTSPQ